MQIELLQLFGFEHDVYGVGYLGLSGSGERTGGIRGLVQETRRIFTVVARVMLALIIVAKFRVQGAAAASDRVPAHKYISGVLQNRVELG